MSGTSTVAERGVVGNGNGGSPHLLFVADSERLQRAGTRAWLDHELGRGAKVYYKGWFDPDTSLERHWLSGPEGPRRGRAALASGQLEFCDFLAVIERCGGTTAGLHRLQADEVARALDDGWSSVAMTQESARRPMADAAEAVEFAAQESGYDALAARWPLRVLCQLTTSFENDAAVWESAAVHHGWVVDGRWSAETVGGRWTVRGDLDAHTARRFGGALAGAMRRARDHRDGPHLHVDLAEVEFLDVACGELMVLSARSAPAGQQLIVHGASRTVRRLLDAVGRPRTLVLLGEGDR